MAIRTINTIQNPKDLAYIQNMSYNYVYESLANLGQRYSIKGDSIISGQFTVFDILDIEETSFDIGKYMSKIYINNNKLCLKLFEINSDDFLTPIELPYTINNMLYSNSEIQLNKKINGVDYYKSNALMFLSTNEYNNNIFTICTLGCDSDLGIVELNIEQYNTTYNTLVSSLKLLDINDTETDSDASYYLYYIEKDDNSNTSSDYVGKKYKISKSTIDNLYGDFSTYAQYLYDTVIVDYYAEYKDITVEAIFSEFLNDGYKNAISEDEISIGFNEGENEGLYTDSEYAPEFNSVLEFIYNQVLYMYNFMYEYYNDYTYKVSNNQLYIKILYNIFVKAFNDSGLSNISNFELYIPTNYVFDYYANDADSYYIYSNQTPISILYTLSELNDDYFDNLFIENISNNYTLQSNILFANTKAYDKVIMYKYNVIYNTKYVNIINSINVSELYAMPYIKDNYWYINDVKTNYKAIGKDAGNPNIILLYSDALSGKTGDTVKSLDYKVLSCYNKSEILGSMEFVVNTANVKLFNNLSVENTSLSEDDIFEVKCAIPTIKEEADNTNLLEQLNGALIINISTINNINTTSDKLADITDILGSDALITTFWVFNSDDDVNAFEYIDNPSDSSNNALTLSQLNGINNIINNEIEGAIQDKLSNISADDLKFTYTIISTGTPTVKNNFSTEITNTYTVLYNDCTLPDILSNTKYNNYYMFNLRYIEDFDGSKFTNSVKYINIQQDTSKMINIYNSNEDAVTNMFNSYYYDYLPSYLCPLINFGESFAYNLNTANRINNCSFDKEGHIYYSYIGTNNTNNEKEVLHWGTYTTNSHIGTDTLVNKNSISYFTKHDAVSIDFDNIYLNSSLTKQITDTCYISNYDYIYTLDSAINNIEYNYNSNSVSISVDVAGDSTPQGISNASDGVFVVKYSTLLSNFNNVHKLKNVDFTKYDSSYIGSYINTNMDVFYTDSNTNFDTDTSSISKYHIISKGEHISGNTYMIPFKLKYNIDNDNNLQNIYIENTVSGYILPFPVSE